MNNKKSAFLFSVFGLLLIGFGLSLLGESILYKLQENFYWVPLGTLALTVTNTGICFIGRAVLLKAKA